MKQEEKDAKKAYGKLAEHYHKMRTEYYPKGWFFNEHLEMPATLSLLGNVRGKKILDFGCGTGIYAKLLTKKGAKIKGFDISSEMIEIAKRENPKLDLKVGSVYKIPFKEKFDIVISSLAVHYVSDWGKMFKQIKKVLKKDGIFVFSTGNPVSECSESIKIEGEKKKVFGRLNYFKKKKVFVPWKMEKEEVMVHLYHRSYEDIIKTIVKNGFEIIDYCDARPTKKGLKLFQDKKIYDSFPLFNVWKLRLK